MITTGFFWYLGSFVLALGLLIVVHELGHFLVAHWCKVKVLRFSVGFGRPFLTRRFGRDGTEWCLAVFPLGGYVKMLDEREGPVAPEEAHRAFNRQSVSRRSAIVLAGPLANLLLAIAVYWAVFLQGVEELRPRLAAPPEGSPAAMVGVRDGDEVRTVGGKVIATWQELRWEVLRAMLDAKPVALELVTPQHETRFVTLDGSALSGQDIDADVLPRLGLQLWRPVLPPVIGRVQPGSPAEQAGMLAGDRIVAIDGVVIEHWGQGAMAIRQAPERTLAFELERQGRRHDLSIFVPAVQEGSKTIGRIGIGVRDDPSLHGSMFIHVDYDALTALAKAFTQTWDTSLLTVRMIGRMLIGEMSLKNVSGPVTIADYAGQSAHLGLSYYLRFIALISISLGVLNLLPIPILDGGHLMYYLLEAIQGKPLPDRFLEVGQQVGLALLVLLMALAFYNDIQRLVSG